MARSRKNKTGGGAGTTRDVHGVLHVKGASLEQGRRGKGSRFNDSALGAVAEGLMKAVQPPRHDDYDVYADRGTLDAAQRSAEIMAQLMDNPDPSKAPGLQAELDAIDYPGKERLEEISRQGVPTPPEILARIAQLAEGDAYSRAFDLAQVNTPPEVLARIAQLAERDEAPPTPADLLDKLRAINIPGTERIKKLFNAGNASPEALAEIAKDADTGVRHQALTRANASPEALAEIAKDADPRGAGSSAREQPTLGHDSACHWPPLAACGGQWHA